MRKLKRIVVILALTTLSVQMAWAQIVQACSYWNFECLVWAYNYGNGTYRYTEICPDGSVHTETGSGQLLIPQVNTTCVTYCQQDLDCYLA